MRYPKPELDNETAMKLWIYEHSEYAKEQVVLNNAGIIGTVLKSMKLDLFDEDFWQIGMVGLLKAVKLADELRKADEERRAKDLERFTERLENAQV